MGDKNPSKQRDDEIVKLFKICNIIINELPAAKVLVLTNNFKNGIIDLDVSDELSGILMTIFTSLRKEKNDNAGYLKYKGYKAKLFETELSIDTIIMKLKAIEPKIELDFLVATPIVEIMTLFKAFFDEVRTGVTKFRVGENVAKRAIKRDVRNQAVGRADPREATQNISQYGLTNQHIPLLQGITIAPERRTGVLRSLGPLAQCLLMIMEDKYYDKITLAITNSLMMLPMNNEIASCLKESNSPGRAVGVLKELGDILLLTTARSTQKAYFPLLALFYMWEHKSAELKWSFSGTDIMKYYSDLIAQEKIKYQIKSGGSPEMTGEAIFHAIFGTYLEDLQILSQITTKETSWATRKEMNLVLVKRSSKAKIEPVMIGFKYVSKMAQAMLTKSLGNIEPCHTSRPSFSGFRKRTFTQEFLNYLTTGKGAQNYSNEPMQLQYALKKIKDQIVEDLNNVKLMQAGTVCWQRKNMDDWVDTDFIPTEGNDSVDMLSI